MASTDLVAAPRRSTKKRRSKRRRQDKPAISARLVLDDHVKSDVGILSDDLFADLFPHLRDSQWPLRSQVRDNRLLTCVCCVQMHPMNIPPMCPCPTSSTSP